MFFNNINTLWYANIEKHNFEEINLFFIDSDIKSDIIVISNFIENIIDNEKNIPKYLKIALQNLSESIDMLSNHIDKLEESVLYQNSLWFNSYRYFYPEEYLEKVKKCKQKVQHRFDLLIKILK